MNKIKCPKCKNKTLRILQEAERHEWLQGCECWCDSCHLFFGWKELAEHWNVDIGDFYDVSIGYVPEPEWEDFDKFLKEVFGYPYLFLTGWEDDGNGRVDYGAPIGQVGT